MHIALIFLLVPYPLVLYGKEVLRLKIVTVTGVGGYHRNATIFILTQVKLFTSRRALKKKVPT